MRPTHRLKLPGKFTQIDRATRTGPGQAGTQADTRKMCTETARHTKKPGQAPLDPFP